MSEDGRGMGEGGRTGEGRERRWGEGARGEHRGSTDEDANDEAEDEDAIPIAQARSTRGLHRSPRVSSGTCLCDRGSALTSSVSSFASSMRHRCVIDDGRRGVSQ